MDKSLLIFQLKTQWRIYSFNDKWTSDSDIHLLKIEWLNLKFYNYLISISCKRAVEGSNPSKSIFETGDIAKWFKAVGCNPTIRWFKSNYRLYITWAWWNRQTQWT